MTIPKIGKDLRDRMKESILKTPFSAVSKEKKSLESFALCSSDGDIVGDEVVVNKGGVVTIPDKCNIGKKNPIGLFFVQDGKNGRPHHVISREILKYAFDDENYDVLCSGYSQKHSEKHGGTIKISKVPKLLCVFPKEGSTKPERRRAIDGLDRITFDMNIGFNSNQYISILRKAFDTKRWTLK